jgi:D-galactarolactone isomerase
MTFRRYTGHPPRHALPTGSIDTQLHLYLPDYPADPNGPAIPAGCPGPAEYRQVMGWLGISRCVVTQGNAHQFDNENLIAALAAMGDIARGVAVITCETPNAELERLHAAGIRGARIMDLPGGATGLSHLEEIDARAAEMGWVLAVQFDGSRICEEETRLANLQSNWILDHHGKIFSGAAPDGQEAAAIQRLLDKGRCHFKLAGIYESAKRPAPTFEDVSAYTRVITAHAPERIVWGTNFPHNQATSAETYPDDAALLDLAFSWLPTDAARQLAFVENPERLFFRS